MTAPALHTEIVRDDPASAVLTVTGEIDLATAPVLARALEDLGPGASKKVHLDVGGVTFLDSSGVSVLVDARRRIEEAGGGLVLHRTNPQVLRVLEITGLDALFEFDPDSPH